MSNTYPHTASFGSAGQNLKFADGLQIIVREGTFTQSFTCTFDTVTGQTIGGDKAVTVAYTVDPSITDPQVVHKLTVILPKLQPGNILGTMTLYTNPHVVPQIDEWVPQGGTVQQLGDPDLLVELAELKTFQVNVENI